MCARVMGAGSGRGLLLAATLSLLAFVGAFLPAPTLPAGAVQGACGRALCGTGRGPRQAVGPRMAIGRGRGTPNDDIWQLGEDMAAQKRKEAPKTPEQARQKKRVLADEISTNQQTQENTGAFSRIKENTKRAAPKKKAVEPAIGRGRLKPRSSMSEQELKLHQKRTELSNMLRNKNSPPVAESLIYVPGFNMEEGGELRRVGQKEEEAVTVDEEPERKLKSPLEVLEMINTLQRYLMQQVRAREDLESRRESVLEIARIKLMRKHWIEWLEGGGEELAESRDPARHTPETRADFLKDMKEAAEFGMKISIPDDEECITFMLSGGSQDRDVRKIASISNKMANDLAQQFGVEETQKIKATIEVVRKENPMPEGGNPDIHNSAVVGLAVLQNYLTRAEDAEAQELRDMAKGAKSVDWVKGAPAPDWSRGRSMSPDYGARPRGVSEDYVRSPSMSQDWVRGGRGGREFDDGYDAPRREVNVDWEREGPERMLDGSLQDGDEVAIKIIAKTPLGYAVLVDNRYDGLVYHSDVFTQPPEEGWRGQAWVSKVRRDGKMDISMRPPGAHRKIADGAKRILYALEQSGGKLPVGDKSEPDYVYDTVGISKKSFKDATGFMFRRRMVVLEDFEVVLRDRGEWAEGALQELESTISAAQERGGGGRTYGGDGVGTDWQRGGVRGGAGSGRGRGGKSMWPERRDARGGGGKVGWGSYVPDNVEAFSAGAAPFSSRRADANADADWSGLVVEDSRMPLAGEESDWGRETWDEEMSEEGLVVSDENARRSARSKSRASRVVGDDDGEDDFDDDDDFDGGIGLTVSDFERNESKE